MAISTIKTESNVIVKEDQSHTTVVSIYKGQYKCTNGNTYTASEIKLVPPDPKPLKKTEIKCSNKPLKRVPLKPCKKAIKKVSKKLQQQIELYKKQREVFLNKNTECQAKLKNCSIMADEVHHMQGRTGYLLLDETKWLPVCHGCHVIITEQSRMAIETGLSLPRNT